MNTDDIISTLSIDELIPFLASPIGKLMWEGVIYFTQGHEPARSLTISRCTTNTWIAIGDIVFCFRHYGSGVAGFTVQDADKDLQAYSCINGDWVLLS